MTTKTRCYRHPREVWIAACPDCTTWHLAAARAHRDEVAGLPPVARARSTARSLAGVPPLLHAA